MAQRRAEMTRSYPLRYCNLWEKYHSPNVSYIKYYSLLKLYCIAL